MPEPERALFLHALPASLPPDISRIYAGAEFCPWRLPGSVELRQILRRAHELGRPFTLVTPVLNEPQRQGLRALLAALLPEFAAGDEVVISDWGALELVRGIDPAVPVVLGRTRRPEGASGSQAATSAASKRIGGTEDCSSLPRTCSRCARPATTR